MEHCPARGARARLGGGGSDDDDEPAALSVASYAALGLRAALARPRDARAAADELAALVRGAGRHVSGGVADEMAADCAAAGVSLARCVALGWDVMPPLCAVAVCAWRGVDARRGVDACA
jgi:hypothetical protein